MEAGIVGLPNVGKSTLFNALTAAGADANNYPFCTIEPNVGIVNVPDPRLKLINEFIKTEKIIPAALRLVDIAGLVRGASQGEGLGNKFLSHIREVEAILHVVRCFEDADILHVEGSVDPLRDVETIEMELMLADMASVDVAHDRAVRQARTGEKEPKARAALLERIKAHLDAEKPVRTLELNPDEAKLLKSFGLLTQKPILYVANVDENNLTGQDNPHVSRLREFAEATGAGLVVVCARLESELAELDEADRLEMLESLEMTEPALHSVAHAAYDLLGLQSYYTAGPKEIRAWTIQKGFTAPQAAGVIHTDFEKGFIRAEIYHVDDLLAHKTEKAIREAGKLRSEGKTYIMQDGDVCHFLFNN